MSRMTKFLKQTCVVEAYQESEDGTAVINRFGEILYEDLVECACRNEAYVQDLQTANGAIVKSTARYFLDESLPLKTNYRIDGKVVLTLQTYVNQVGKIEGYEVYV